MSSLCTNTDTILVSLVFLFQVSRSFNFQSITLLTVLRSIYIPISLAFCASIEGFIPFIVSALNPTSFLKCIRDSLLGSLDQSSEVEHIPKISISFFDNLAAIFFHISGNFHCLDHSVDHQKLNVIHK